MVSTGSVLLTSPSLAGVLSSVSFTGVVDVAGLVVSVAFLLASEVLSTAGVVSADFSSVFWTAELYADVFVAGVVSFLVSVALLSTTVLAISLSASAVLVIELSFSFTATFCWFAFTALSSDVVVSAFGSSVAAFC